MTNETENFIADLSGVEPEVLALHEFVKKFDGIDVCDAAGSIFEYIEKHSDEDLGTPGPLVHLVETIFPKYIGELKNSVARKPTQLTVWMLNRVLNAEIEPFLRDDLLKVMNSISEHPRADKPTVEEAQRFLEHQRNADSS